MSQYWENTVQNNCCGLITQTQNKATGLVLPKAEEFSREHCILKTSSCEPSLWSCITVLCITEVRTCMSKLRTGSQLNWVEGKLDWGTYQISSRAEEHYFGLQKSIYLRWGFMILHFLRFQWLPLSILSRNRREIKLFPK